ncbi:MAG: sodium-dependent bicarbonate transport family permease [Anaerolineae bacterium]|nr:sodium-dependent bicarbonate transport family permease [Candidatus Roseilinea sp.]MDW8449498.1 sodium-dependent bicarbonate transport family permease [Anaerolineae bacterium]
MSADLIASNLLNPPVLFFLLGILAALVKSDLELPAPIPKVLSLYLLLALGFKGGVALRENNGGLVLPALGAALLMALAVPLYAFPMLRRRLSLPDAAAVAATYGSVSAVTFVTATAFLQRLGEPQGGYMTAALALMESPAIVVGVLLARLGRHNGNDARGQFAALFHEAMFNGSVLLLVGSLAIGYVVGKANSESLKPFTESLFPGLLSLFLLDMGLVVGRRLGDLRRIGAFLIAFAFGLPLVNAALGILIAWLIGLPVGDALLFVVLCASASYIAVPAAMRQVLPQANPALYVTMALALTFPFNVVLGIPLYMSVISALWR